MEKRVAFLPWARSSFPGRKDGWGDGRGMASKRKKRMVRRKVGKVVALVLHKPKSSFELPRDEPADDEQSKQ